MSFDRRRYNRTNSMQRNGRNGGPSLTSVMMGAFAIALATGALILALIEALSADLPSLEQLETYKPRLITKVYGQDGSVIKEFYVERRTQVPLDSISPYLVDAVLATEDHRFYKHWGIDPIGIARAVAINVITMSREEGASTLTQQLARNLYLHHRKTYRRKIREMITAVQIERTYAKDEILQMYFTQMYFGHGAYGIQSAANFYFGKDASELTLDESALLVGLLKAPNYYTPLRRPNEALRRRNTVLHNMYVNGFVSRDEYALASHSPIRLAEDSASDLGVAPHFTEWVRRDLEKMQETYGFDYYRDGLRVQTTLDPELQACAQVAVDSHMTKFQAAFNERFISNGGLKDWLTDSYRDSLRARKMIAEDDTTLKPVEPRALRDTLLALGTRIVHPRIEVDSLFAHSVELDTMVLDSLVYDTIPAEKLLRDNGLELEGLVKTILEDKATVDSLLDKHFTVQVAFVAMNPYNGDVWAMVGGRDFRRSEFNRAVQAERQPGSVFKPFVYTAVIDNGIYANYRVLNMVQPLKLDDGTWWRPENYNVENRGEYVTLREGLRRSLNNVTVRIVAGEDRIVPIQEVVRYARRMGISTRLRAVPAAALGSNDVIPLDVVTAYGVFAAGGVRTSPRSITRIQNRNGQEIATFGVEREVVLSEETAAIMVDLLQNVVDRGTGGSARWRWGFRAPAGGKTGTTNNFNNAWFAGFTPHIVAVAWVGFDNPQISLGYGQSGASAALPIWAIFMKEAFEIKGWKHEDFQLPVGVVQQKICEDTGMRAGPYCPNIYEELFRRGDEPFEPCDLHSAPGAGGTR